MRILIIAFVLLQVSCADTSDNKIDKETLIAELISVSAKEQEAFKRGDCETVKMSFDDNAQVYLNGKKVPSVEMLYNFCKSVPRPFSKPGENKLYAYAISNSTGYTVRILDLEDKDSLGNYTREVITKVFNKIDDKWKIVHMNSSISKANANQ
jgi:hypothetical protein